MLVLELSTVSKVTRKFIGNENIITNIYRIQAYDSTMLGYFCIGFIDFMLKDKSCLESTNLFSPNEYKKNDKIILKCFQYNLNKLKCVVMFAINIENLKNLKYHIFLKELWVFLLFTVSVVMNIKKIFKEEESTEILKSLGFINNIEQNQKIYNHFSKKNKKII